MLELQGITVLHVIQKHAKLYFPWGVCTYNGGSPASCASCTKSQFTLKTNNGSTGQHDTGPTLGSCASKGHEAPSCTENLHGCPSPKPSGCEHALGLPGHSVQGSHQKHCRTCTSPPPSPPSCSWPPASCPTVPVPCSPPGIRLPPNPSLQLKATGPEML